MNSRASLVNRPGLGPVAEDDIVTGEELQPGVGRRIDSHGRVAANRQVVTGLCRIGTRREGHVGSDVHVLGDRQRAVCRQRATADCCGCHNAVHIVNGQSAVQINNVDLSAGVIGKGQRRRIDLKLIRAGDSGLCTQCESTATTGNIQIGSAVSINDCAVGCESQGGRGTIVIDIGCNRNVTGSTVADRHNITRNSVEFSVRNLKRAGDSICS